MPLLPPSLLHQSATHLPPLKIWQAAAPSCSSPYLSEILIAPPFEHLHGRRLDLSLAACKFSPVSIAASPLPSVVGHLGDPIATGTPPASQSPSISYAQLQPQTSNPLVIWVTPPLSSASRIIGSGCTLLEFDLTTPPSSCHPIHLQVRQAPPAWCPFNLIVASDLMTNLSIIRHQAMSKASSSPLCFPLFQLPLQNL